MDTLDIDIYFDDDKSFFQEVDRSFKEITAIQRGEVTVLKTGFKPLDESLVSGANNKMIFIGARPGHGKTHNCETIIDNLRDKELNPGLSVKILRMNLEMPTQALILRATKRALKKSTQDILANPFTDEEREIVKREVYPKFKDPNILNFSNSVDGEALSYLIDKFVQTGTKKDNLVVLVDHLHVYHDKTTIDAVLKICNEAKMKHSNLTFIFYFQLNRTLEDSWRDAKSNKLNQRNMFPHAGHIYLTDMLQQYADIVIGIVIPQIAGIDEFAVVNKEHNKQLERDFIPGKTEGKFATLRGRNRIYYNIIKLRGIDDFDFPTIFSDIIDEQKEGWQPDLPDDDVPTFDSFSPALKNAREEYTPPPKKEDIDLESPF